MYKIKSIGQILIIGLVTFLSQNIFSQSVSKSGTTAASFLEIGVSAGAVGMGGAFVSIANDASALYWNASGIADIQMYEAIIVHTDWIAGTNFDFGGIVLPLGGFGSLGFSFSSLSMDDMKVTTVEQPEGTGEFFSANDIAVGISYARNLTELFAIGFTVKYIEQRIWHMSASTFAVDIGTKFRTDLLGGMVIGASISNFGAPLKMEGRDGRYFIRVDNTKLGSNERIPTTIEMDSWELPLTFQIGVSTYAVNNDNYKFLVAVDAKVPNNNYQSLNVGGELSFKDLLFLRGGYNSLFLRDGEGGLSLGVGINSKMLFSNAIVNFDYAFRDFGRIKDVHNLSVGIKF